MDGIKQAILDIIGNCYKSCYVGRLKIKEFPVGYDVMLFLGTDTQPIHIAAQLEYEDFLKYFEDEIRKRHLSDTKYYTGYRTDAFEPHRMNPI